MTDPQAERSIEISMYADVEAIRALKRKIYGFIKRSELPVAMLGVAVLEIDRAMRQLPMDAMANEKERAKLQTSIETAIAKALAALQQVKPELKNVKDLAPFEQEWTKEIQTTSWWTELFAAKDNAVAKKMPKTKAKESRSQEQEQSETSSEEQMLSATEAAATRESSKQGDNPPVTSTPAPPSTRNQIQKDQNKAQPRRRKSATATSEQSAGESQGEGEASSVATSGLWKFIKQEYRKDKARPAAKPTFKQPLQTDRDKRKAKTLPGRKSKAAQDISEGGEADDETSHTQERPRIKGNGKKAGKPARAGNDHPPPPKPKKANKLPQGQAPTRPFDGQAQYNPYQWGWGPPQPPYWPPMYPPPIQRQGSNSAEGQWPWSARNKPTTRRRVKYPQGWHIPPPEQIPMEYRCYNVERVVAKGLIKPFLGTIEDYPRWQSSFYNMIHIQPGPVFMKVLAMDKLITDKNSVELLAGLGNTEADYISRIQRLEQEYGGPNRLKTYHLRILRKLEGNIDDNLQQLKKYSHAFENYLRNSPEEEADNMLLMQVIKGKMSRALRVEYNGYIKHERIPDDNTSIALFLRDKLSNEVEAREDEKLAGLTEAKKTVKTASKEKEKKRKAKQLHAHERRTIQSDSSSSSSTETDEVHVAHEFKRNDKPYKDTSKDRKFGPCHCCKSDEHWVQNCEKFYAMKPNDRREFATSGGLCYICLSSFHKSKDCPKRESRKCNFCKAKHHWLLHPVTQNLQAVAIDDSDTWEITTTSSSDSEDSSNYVSCAFQQARKPHVKDTPQPLDIAITYLTVKLTNPDNNRSIVVNLLADSGANNCSIDSHLAKELGLKGPKAPYYVQVGGGKLNSYSAFSATLRVAGLQTGSNEYEVQFQVYRRPCGRLARLNWADKKANWPHLKGLELPEAAQRPVEGIVGTSEPWLLAALEPAITGGRHEPIATKTRLGWLVGGPVHPSKINQSSVHVTFMERSDKDSSYEQAKRHLHRFWEPSTDWQAAKIFNSKRQPSSDTKAASIFERTVTRLANGQFQVGLLWSNKEPNLSPNHDAALRMFHSLERQLDCNENMRENFNKTLNDWKNTNIAQYVESVEEIKYFLPTFMVIRTDKATTAYRVVVDGARKFAGACINDRLLAGPSLIYHIFDVLCRMRLGDYAVTCDVQTMYLKVKVPATRSEISRGVFSGSISSTHASTQAHQSSVRVKIVPLCSDADSATIC